MWIWSNGQNIWRLYHNQISRFFMIFDMIFDMILFSMTIVLPYPCSRSEGLDKESQTAHRRTAHKNDMSTISTIVNNNRITAIATKPQQWLTQLQFSCVWAMWAKGLLMKISDVKAAESGRSRAADSDWPGGEDSEGPVSSSSWLSWVSADQTANLK